MAYDEGLAQRIRDVLQVHAGIAEKRMFGGIAFLLHGRMVVGVAGSALMARVGPVGMPRRSVARTCGRWTSPAGR